MIPDITLPDLSDVSDKRNYEKIAGYLSTLHDQLRYMTLNLDEENLSDRLALTIDTAASDAAFCKESVVKLGDDVSSVSQTADKINWIVADGESSSNFSLTSYAANLIADSINIIGYVKFSDLENEGLTSIDGANIKTGTISADKLSVGDLSALSANVGGWSLSSSGISSYAPGSGSIHLNSAASSSDKWLSASDASGKTTFYINKDGSCYFNGGYISGGSVTYDKLSADSESRLDLTNNYNATKIGQALYLSTPNLSRRIFVTEAGLLCFETGCGNSAFTFGLNREGSNFTLNVLTNGGYVVGKIPLVAD